MTNEVSLDWAGFWIGHPATLLPFHGFIEPFGVDEDMGVVLDESLGGGVRAAVPRHRPLRSWSIDLPKVYPRDVKNLRTLVTATLPPWQLVTPEAQAGNILTPERSVMLDQDLPAGGAWPIADGDWTATVRLNPSAAFSRRARVTIGPAPTPPVWTGRKVTVGLLAGTNAQGGGYALLRWLDAAANQIGADVQGNAVQGMDALRHSTVTGTPPAGAVACQILADYLEVIAEPQVTWTDGPVEWSPGAGVDNVVLMSMPRTILTARDGQVLQDVSFTAQEVGPA